MSLTFKAAQDEFMKLLGNVKPKDVSKFLHWVQDTFETENDEKKPKFVRDANETLHLIAEHIKQRVPQNAILESENILWPKTGYDSDCNPTNTVNVDCFLYDDNDVEDLVQAGKLTRTYCQDCGSKNTTSLTFISHSLAVPQLEFLFTQAIPLKKQADGFTVLDIGSRLGAIVFAANAFSQSAVRSIGIELNEDLCKLQKDVVSEFGLENVEIVCADVRTQGDLLKQANVVVMNNVFGFFWPVDEQIACWEFLKSTIKPGTLLVHQPDINELLKHLKLSFKQDDWLEEISTVTKCANFAGGDETLFEDCSNLHIYRVKDINAEA